MDYLPRRRSKMGEYLSKEEVAKQMRDLAKNVKNAEIAIEISDLASKVQEEGDKED